MLAENRYSVASSGAAQEQFDAVVGAVVSFPYVLDASRDSGADGQLRRRELWTQKGGTLG